MIKAIKGNGVSHFGSNVGGNMLAFLRIWVIGHWPTFLNFQSLASSAFLPSIRYGLSGQILALPT